MGIVTTHTEGRVVTHSDDDTRPVEVAQLPLRDAAAAAEQPTAPAPAPAPAKAPKPTPAVKAAVKQQRTRTKKAAEKK